MSHCRKISGRRLLRGGEVRLCRPRGPGAGSAQERAVFAAGWLQALVACPEQSQSVGLCAQQLCEEGEAFALRQVRARYQFRFPSPPHNPGAGVVVAFIDQIDRESNSKNVITNNKTKTKKIWSILFILISAEKKSSKKENRKKKICQVCFPLYAFHCLNYLLFSILCIMYCT